MLVSFVIPAHDEELSLPQTLCAIRSAASEIGLEHEIVVADDASTDRTAEVARAGGARVVSHQRRQISATRNLGARAAKGDFLIFVDADTRVTAGAVRDAVEVLTNGAVGGGAMVRFDGWIPLYAKLLLAVLVWAFRLTKRCGGAFAFCTREALERAGWWNESVFAAEEIYFAKELKRLGDFVIIGPTVVTSGRKLRTHSGWEILGFFVRAAFGGRRFFADRSKLPLWYAPRRTDPMRMDKDPLQ